MYEIDSVVYLDGEEECTYMGMAGNFHCLRDRNSGMIYQTDDDDRIHDNPRLGNNCNWCETPIPVEDRYCDECSKIRARR